MATSSLRSRIHISLASVAIVLLAACASAPPTPSVDYNAAYDFDAVKTVALYRAAETAPGEDPLKMSDMTRDRIESGLRSALTARGFTLVNSVEEADLLLSWHLVTEDKMDVRSYEVPSATTMGMYGPGFYRYNTYSMYSCWSCMSSRTEVSVHEYTQGTFVVDMIDPEQQRSVWRSVTTSRLKGELGREQSKYDEAANLVLGSFPPANSAP
ncbi:MAG: DUF4136 domain-containing protein [Halieaceae bacterium]|jgi:hypothetical protein|uniref:DUF4136 domain-containing protein n=1 Tax=Haliea alexandrii TaxID=2448162 RepID=UPI000F0B9337|nr:DUF4136 domain-containing protein [Haliea alexandrii]MCR9184264.1 DUF4136 domain-containing protein [Halieaceae bacterium]